MRQVPSGGQADSPLPKMAGNWGPVGHDEYKKQLRAERRAEYARFLAAQQGRPPRLHEAHAVDEAAAERTLLEPHSPSELVPRKFGQGLRAMHWGAGGGIASEAVIRKKAYSDELQRQIRERKEREKREKEEDRMMAQAHVAGAYNMPGMGGPPSPDWRAGGGGGAGGGGYGAAPPHDYRPPPHGGGDGYGGHGGAPPPPRYDGGGGGGGGGGGYHHAGQEPGQGYYQPQGQAQWGPESPPKRAPGPGWGAEQQQSHVSPVHNMGRIGGGGGGGGGGGMPPRMHAISQMHGGGAVEEARARSKAVYAAELDAQIREQRARKQQEKEARQRQELRDDERLAAYNPFGRGGGGAPLRNAHGQVITDLKANLRDINSDEPISSQQAQLHLANQGNNEWRSYQQQQQNHQEEPLDETRAIIPGGAAAGGGHRMRFRTDNPEITDSELQGKYDAQRAMQQALQAQIEEKKRLKQQEEEKEREQEAADELRLVREQEELRRATDDERAEKERKAREQDALEEEMRLQIEQAAAGRQNHVRRHGNPNRDSIESGRDAAASHQPQPSHRERPPSGRASPPSYKQRQERAASRGSDHGGGWDQGMNGMGGDHVHSLPLHLPLPGDDIRRGDGGSRGGDLDRRRRPDSVTSQSRLMMDRLRSELRDEQDHLKRRMAQQEDDLHMLRDRANAAERETEAARAEVQRMQEALHRRERLANMDMYGNVVGGDGSHAGGKEYLPHEMEALNLGVPVPTYHQALAPYDQYTLEDFAGDASVDLGASMAAQSSFIPLDGAAPNMSQEYLQGGGGGGGGGPPFHDSFRSDGPPPWAPTPTGGGGGGGMGRRQRNSEHKPTLAPASMNLDDLLKKNEQKLKMLDEMNKVAGRTDQLDDLLKQFLDQSGGGGGGGYGDDDVIVAESPAPAPQFNAKAAFLPTGMPLAEQSLAGKSDWLGL